MTNLYETKAAPAFDSLTPGTEALGESGESSGMAGALAARSLDSFRNAVRDEIVDRELGREELSGSAAMAMVGAFTKAAETKRAYAQSLGDLSKYYLVDALLNLIADETLIKDIMTGEIVELQGANKALDDELRVLQRRLNIDQMIEDVTLDLLKHGDYTLSMEMNSTDGVVAVSDDVKQENIVALYRHGMPEKFLIREKAKIRILSANTHLHFALGRSKLRIELGDEFNIHDKDLERLKAKLPNYIRVGRPLLYGVQSKLKELQLLEALVPASKLHQLSTGSLVGVSVPNQTDPKEAFQISRRYESLLNSKTALDKRTGTLADVGDILATAGRTKVVPVMGEKGNLQTLDVKESRVADDMLNSIRDIRATICSTIGVPPELLFGSDSPESKGEFLKRHARYLRKIKSVQSALSDGLKQLALAHLLSKGHDAMPQDIRVVFRNEVVNIDELDKLEFADSVSRMTSELWMFMQELDTSDQFSGRVDWDAMSEWMRRHLALMGSSRSFLKPVEEDLSEDGGGDDGGGSRGYQPKAERRYRGHAKGKMREHLAKREARSATTVAEAPHPDTKRDALMLETMRRLVAAAEEEQERVSVAQPAEESDGITPKMVIEGDEQAAPDAEPPAEPGTITEAVDETEGAVTGSVTPEAEPSAAETTTETETETEIETEDDES